MARMQPAAYAVAGGARMALGPAAKPHMCHFAERREAAVVSRRHALCGAAAAVGVALVMPLGEVATKDARAEGAKDAVASGREMIEDALAAIEKLQLRGSADTGASSADLRKSLETMKSSSLQSQALQKLFNDASKSLPRDIRKTYGGDGGQWLGLRNEAVEASSALEAELAYLLTLPVVEASDMSDARDYFETLRDKTRAFIALFDNADGLNKRMTGGSFCSYSSAAVCDDVDVDASKNTGIRYGK
eukprot:CAMPEP_0185831774 /NCGR_PEP_ID=MMETSP1353-20130828/1699_1 /TAXON_ID=1077150 /ORGANISM="Erythrolobus australicus, Strain CCMP3124" /LENGTH=246 /DNA_ID=CAMNT_0028529883 /DNA_START=103 /DNA_END=843 /DNA_ORIENTATION=+